MKRLYLFVVTICACVTNAYSQLQVDSTGNVAVGMTDEVFAFEMDSVVHSPFAVCTVGIPEAIANFQGTDRQYVLTAYSDRRNTEHATGIWSVGQTEYGDAEGVIGVGMSNSYGVSNNVIGIRGASDGGYNAVGVYGGHFVYTGNSYNYAGIYGTTNSTYPYFQYPGNYAGYFNGTVRTTGPMYAQALYVPSANSTGGGNNMTTTVSLIGEEESVTNKLRNVALFELQHNEQPVQAKQPEPAEEFLKGRSIQELSKRELHQLDSICLNATPTETDPLSSVNYGLDAEQLKAVFPKLVQQDKEGNYSINYVEMVPLLVKSINELSEEIARLKGEDAAPKRAKAETTGIEETSNDIDMVRMDQNKPNPFSESTVIGLNIPEKTQKANIFIYDLSGKQIQNVMVTERGETNITVYASDLNAGMYIYTLVVDGKVVVTRRMMVSK